MSGRVRYVVMLAFLLAGANALPAGEDHVALVPWRVVEPGAVVDAPLILFWIPASPDELRRSPLLTSEELTLFSSRCVAMRVVRPNDSARMDSLAADGELPMAVLTNDRGEILGRIEGDSLSVAEVEELVREELDERAANADALLDRARELTQANDVDAALELYNAVWAARCLCPRQGKDAKRAMRKLARK